MIRARADARCKEALVAGAPYVVLVVPLLVESGTYRGRVDRVAVVDCEDETRIGRVMARSGLSRAEIECIMAAQASREDRLAAADDIIDNNGSREELAVQIADLHRRYMARTMATS
jgi:dephospho-CoA kinase